MFKMDKQSVTLLGVMWQPGRDVGLGRMHTSIWYSSETITALLISYTAIQNKKFKKKKKRRKISTPFAFHIENYYSINHKTDFLNLSSQLHLQFPTSSFLRLNWELKTKCWIWVLGEKSGCMSEHCLRFMAMSLLLTFPMDSRYWKLFIYRTNCIISKWLISSF